MSRVGDAVGKDKRTAPGFTLIELLVVLTVLALLSTLATPLIQRTVPGSGLLAAAEELRTELRLARSAAIRDNRDAWLLIDVDSGKYRRGDGRRVRSIAPEIGLTLVTARREQISESQGRIRFFPDGTSTGGAVRLQRGERAYEVAVDWFDGQVSIDESEAQ